jgi:hypothetical protein
MPACGWVMTICIYRQVVPAAINTAFDGLRRFAFENPLLKIQYEAGCQYRLNSDFHHWLCQELGLNSKWLIA